MILRLRKNQLKVILLFSILLIHILPISAEFSEDFSENNQNNWLFFAWDWNSNTSADPTFALEDGYLVSSGSTQKWDIINNACQETGIDNGYFRYDLYIPEGDVMRFGFRISAFPGMMENFPNQPESNPSLLQVVVTMGVRDPKPAILIGQLMRNATYTSGHINLAGEFVAEEDIRGWHTIDVHKNDTHVSVDLDGVKKVTGEIIQDLVDQLNAICLWTDSGSGMRIDNIKASSSPVSEKQNGQTLFSPVYLVIISLLFITVFRRKTHG